MLCRSKSESRAKKVKGRRVKPEIIHIRKPSLSSSVSSASSVSTARSPPYTSHSFRHTHPIDMDPLGLHPTFVPPPRLSERPFILPQNDHSGGVEDHVLEHYFRSQDSNLKMDAMPAPPTDSPTPMQHSNHEAQPRSDEGGDYFLYKLHLLEHQEKQRQQVLDSMGPALNRSRWSESTIQTIDMDETAIIDDDEEEEDDEDDHSVLEMAIPERQVEVRHPASWQNFSYKRDPLTPASPRRPPIKTMDSVEDFIKRGGWKRRGIVFQNEEAGRSESSMF